MDYNCYQFGIMFESYQCRALLSLLGACMITMAVGLMYLWGIVAIYVTSYFRIVANDPTLTERTTDIIFPLSLLGQAISIPIAARFFRKSSPRFVCMISGAVLSGLLYMSSYSQSFSTFSLIFGLGSGIILGILYIYPIAHCFTFYPHKRTTISGIIISFSGIGTVIFSYLAQIAINPDNAAIDPNFLYFGSQIALRFPFFLRNLSVLLLFLVSGGGLLLLSVPEGVVITANLSKKEQEKIMHMNQEFSVPLDEKEETAVNPFGNMNYELAYISRGPDIHVNRMPDNDREFWPSVNERESSTYQPPDHKENAKQVQSTQANEAFALENQNECPRTRDAPKELIFWIIFLCIMLSSNFGLMVSCNYKTYVKLKMSDRFLTIVGAVGSLACGMSRFLWAALMEKMSLRLLLWVLLVVNSFLSFTIFYFSGVPVIYACYVFASLVCYGGFLGVFPAIASRTFGFRYGSQIYGLLFYAFPLSNFVQLFLMNFIEPVFGYWFVFMASGGMSVCGLLLSSRLTGEFDWSQRIRENNERKRMQAR